MDVFVANEQPLSVNEARLAALARHVLTSEEVDGEAELSVLLVTPDHMRRLNSRYAGADYATDVLAFPMMEDEENSLLLGDVVVCPEIAQHNSAKLGHGVAREIETLVIHGTLHLLGYDHQNEEDGEAMARRQRELLVSFDPVSS